ncbi:unnamed protein product [Haemonchus placei]|uniref:Pept_C1 domain-containing protein n=1 Tax=Haemonchus placei TaxID=6290 RepID=A0A158QPE3_HAEPC|nr:unnamed protein product [Haemonchus placei]
MIDDMEDLKGPGKSSTMWRDFQMKNASTTLVPLILVIFVISDSFQRESTVEEFAAQPIPKYAQELTGEALVKYVNKKQSYFEAKYSPELAEIAEKRLGSLMKMEFLHQPPGEHRMMMPAESVLNQQYPESFDARDKWKNCTSIGYIRDQSNCAHKAYMLPEHEGAIKEQIMTKGPVQAAFIVYEDFSFYKGGIYVVSKHLSCCELFDNKGKP